MLLDTVLVIVFMTAMQQPGLMTFDYTYCCANDGRNTCESMPLRIRGKVDVQKARDGIFNKMLDKSVRSCSVGVARDEEGFPDFNMHTVFPNKKDKEA